MFERLLGSENWGLCWVLGLMCADTVLCPGVGWAKFMEWKYPVEVVITNKSAFRAAGIVEAAL